MVVLQEEIGSAFTIGSIKYVYSHQDPSYANAFSVSMAHVDADVLTDTFTQNYQPGALMEVYHTDSLPLSGGIGDELVIELDTPFSYNGQDNLLIDIYYPEGNCYTQVYNWEAGTDRSLVDMFLPGGSGSNSGYLGDWVPYMILETPLSLQQSTFGAVKAVLGGMD